MTHIAQLTLDEAHILRRSLEIEHERRVALEDLLAENQFILHSQPHIASPYHVFISTREGRLRFRLCGAENSGTHEITLALVPLRRVIKDYFMIAESYLAASADGRTDRIQTLDMARRGLHNEGAEALQALLAADVTMDFDTARRLFTLVCVLHLK
jgi:uncharacterized protein (UPF0262 family)